MTVDFTATVVDVAVTGRRGEKDLTIRITVTGVDDLPVAQSDAITTDEDVTIVDGQLTGAEADGDVLTFSVADGGAPVNGSLTINSDGSYNYIPDDDFNGDDSFTFEVRDENDNVDTGTVSITVRAVNDAPVGQPAATTGFEEQDNAIDRQLFAEDQESDSLSFSIAPDCAPANGVVTISEAGFYS